MRPKNLILAVAALAAGAAAAVTLTFPGAASAWDWHSLPAGYVVSYYTTCYDDNGVNHEPNCGAIPTCDHLSISSSGGSFTEADCTSTFQGDLDAYIARTVCTVNPGSDPALCSPTTTTTAVTTADQSTSTAAATTTVVATTTATTTAAAPADATTGGGSANAAAPALAAPTSTTTTATCDLDCLNQRVTLLEQLYKQLSDSVSAIANADAAAWQTYSDEINAGVSPADAALDARSAGLNALYGLEQ